MSPGHYLVLATWVRDEPASVDGPNLARSPNAPIFGYTPNFYPGTLDATRASPVSVSAGAEISGVDFRLAPNRTYKIRGTVLNLPTSGLRAISVEAVPRDGDELIEAHPAAPVNLKTGEFEISGVWSGYYLVAASWQSDSGPRICSQPVEVVSADVENITLVLSRSVEVRGHVVMEGVLGSGEALRVGLITRENTLLPLTEAEVKPDGSFVVPNVSDGTFAIRVWSGCAACYLKSARSNGADILQRGLRVSTNAPPSPIELLYSSDSGALDGIVSKADGSPAAGALVVLVPDPPYREEFPRYFKAPTDQYGAFSLSGVPPGGYNAFAWQQMEEDSFEDPDFLRLFENQAQPLSIKENAKTTLQLVLLPSNTQ